MKKQLHIGAIVSVLDENLKGEVISIHGDSIQILDADGFEWTYKANELVLHNASLFSEKILKNKEDQTTIKNKNNQLIQLGDFVSVLDDKIKGQVIEINGKQITIEENNGFKSSIHVDALIVYDTILSKDKTNIPEPITEEKSIKIQKIVKSSIVDLHNTNNYLDKNKILLNQISIFKDELNFAISKGQTQIIFIHGKGEGILRKEIEDILRKQKINYKKAPHRDFGQGAIQVSLIDVNWIVR